MKTNGRKSFYPVTNAGSVLLLVTFIILCLSMFAALSLSSALAEYRYSRKLAQHNTDYYQASNLATDMMKTVDGILKNAYALDPEHYYETAEEQLSPLVHTNLNSVSEPPSVAYEIPVDDARFLKVVLELNPPGQMESGYYRITSWQEIPAATWNGDDSPNLVIF